MSPRRRSGFLAPFLTALGVFALLHVYVAQRLFVAPALPVVLAVGGCVLLALVVVLVPVGFVFSRKDRGWPSRLFPPLAIGWLGVSGVLLTVTVVTDLGRLLFGLLHGWPDAVAALHHARLQAVAIALGTAVLVPFAIWTARGRLVLSRVRVPLEKLAPGVAGLRIVQISDLHIGDRLGEAFVRRVVDRVNALRPDVVAITGDLVDGPVHVVEKALRPLADLVAPHGVFFVTGNHEYYWDCLESVRMVKALGVTVLHNEHRVVERAGGSVVIGGIPISTADGSSPTTRAGPIWPSPARQRALPACCWRTSPARSPAPRRTGWISCSPAIPMAGRSSRSISSSGSSSRSSGGSASCSASGCTRIAAPGSGARRCACSPRRRSQKSP